MRDIIDPTRNLGHVDRLSETAPTLDSTDVKSPSSTAQVDSSASCTSTAETILAPICKPLNRLPTEDQLVGSGERKSTPMDVNSQRKSATSDDDGGVINGSGRFVVGGGIGFCRPGDEDCG